MTDPRDEQPHEAPQPSEFDPPDAAADGGAEGASDEVESAWRTSSAILEAGEGGRAAETVELLRRHQNGDPQALGELLRRYLPRITIAVRARLPRQYQGRSSVEDVVQETCLRVIENIDRFEYRSRGSFLRWVTTIAINEIRGVHDYLTREKRGGGVGQHWESIVARFADQGESISLEPAGSGDLPFDEVERREEREVVIRCLRDLSENHREAIVLRAYLGLSFRELGDELGIGPDAAERRYYRAKIALGRCLERRAPRG